jgi:hypothetical protein
VGVARAATPNCDHSARVRRTVRHAPKSGHKFQCKIDVVHHAGGCACQETKTDQDQQDFLEEHVLLLDNASDVATTMVLAAGVACLALLPVVKLAQGPLLISVGRITAPHIDHA